MSDYIQDAIVAARLQMGAEALGDQRYRVTLTSPDRISPWGPWRETVTMQPGTLGPPTLGQVLYYTASRLQAVEDTDDYLDWCAETGRTPSDGAALNRYRDLVDLRDVVRGTMGDDAYRRLLGGYAIDQAVARARASLGSARDGG